MATYGTGGAMGGWTDDLYKEYDYQKKNPEQGATAASTAAWNKQWTDAYGNIPSSYTDTLTAPEGNPNINAPNQSLPKPNYTGLMGGDYDKLQSSLAVGGKIAATDAYNTGTQNLNNTMSGRGLYGSSIMQQQQTQGLDREYMNALAKNEASAATARYQMQQSDLQKAGDIGLGLYNADTGLLGTKYTADNAFNMNAANNLATLNNTGLLTASAQNVANLNNASGERIATGNNTTAEDVATTNATASNYNADRSFAANANRDKTTIEEANIVATTNKYGIDMTSKTAAQQIAAGMRAAADRNDSADLAALAGLAGVSLAAVMDYASKPGKNFSDLIPDFMVFA